MSVSLTEQHFFHRATEGPGHHIQCVIHGFFDSGVFGFQSGKDGIGQFAGLLGKGQ